MVRRATSAHAAATYYKRAHLGHGRHPVAMLRHLMPLILCLVARCSAANQECSDAAPTGQLSGHLAVITGASRGVGAELARVYAQEGALIVVNYFQNKDKGEAVASEINDQHGPRAIALYGDVTVKADMKKLVADAETHFGKRVSIVVNNALARYQFNPTSPMASIKTVTVDDLDQQMKGTLAGAMNMVQAALPSFEAANFGKVVNIGSNLVYNPVVTYYDYSAAKAALRIVRSALERLERDGVVALEKFRDPTRRNSGVSSYYYFDRERFFLATLHRFHKLEKRLQQIVAEASEIAIWMRCPKCKNRCYSLNEAVALTLRCSCGMELEDVPKSVCDWSTRRGAAERNSSDGQRPRKRAKLGTRASTTSVLSSSSASSSSAAASSRKSAQRDEGGLEQYNVLAQFISDSKNIRRVLDEISRFYKNGFRLVTVRPSVYLQKIHDSRRRAQDIQYRYTENGNENATGETINALLAEVSSSSDEGSGSENEEVTSSGPSAAAPEMAVAAAPSTSLTLVENTNDSAGSDEDYTDYGDY